ncbi:hypothetical protein [Desulfosporosinus sp. Sb-LF]|uniref:hypothetical protein n=1 Tax=Desulfosporosinus sp. Sb-LF TaxID=2560027 RepID=UPI00107F8CAC|nr:hypothetical protein [Desulfosporosinus sp. Sb-LF]TGE32644.1 hypothetical protein E4K68_10730 [Desulfosporosinus sp. Sb-LF]
MTVLYAKLRVLIKPCLNWGLVVGILVTSLISSLVIDSKRADANTATATPGSAAVTTKLTLTPLKKGDTFQYLINTAAISTLPVTGGTLPTGTTIYTSGNDITGVDVDKYIDVYEVDGTSNIVAFKEFKLTANNIAAPVLTTLPVADIGASAGSTKLTLVANNSGDTFKVQVVSKVTPLPALGATASGKAYTAGSDLTGVDATTNKYVNVYEVDGTGKIVAFSEITLTAGNITAPVVKTATATPGSAAVTTKLTLTPLKKGDTFQYLINTAAISTLPVTGGTLPTGTTIYTSGNDITGVDVDKYIDVYEVDGTSNIVAFKEFKLTANNIAAPVLTTLPVADIGASAGSTKLTLVANNSGDTFKVQVVSKVTPLPALGATASGKAYTAGSDLTGVDATTNKYVNVYEVDGTGKIVAFSEITLTAGNITAPSL